MGAQWYTSNSIFFIKPEHHTLFLLVLHSKKIQIHCKNYKRGDPVHDNLRTNIF